MLLWMGANTSYSLLMFSLWKRHPHCNTHGLLAVLNFSAQQGSDLPK